MKYAKQLQNLGTETAFAVSAQARQWSEKGNKVYPFHLGDINLPTPKNIVEATVKSIKDGLTGYCPSEGIFPLREASRSGNIPSEGQYPVKPSLMLFTVASTIFFGVGRLISPKWNGYTLFPFSDHCLA